MFKSTKTGWLAALCLAGAAPAAHAAANPNAAVLTVRCGVMDAGNPGDKAKCNKLDIDKGKSQGQFLDGTVEIYSGGTLVATEIDPQVYSKPDGNTGSVDIVVTGNGDAKKFAAWYIDSATSIFNMPDITVKVWSDSKSPKLVLNQPYNPTSSALWAMHSADSVDLAAQIAAHEKADDNRFAAESAARQAGDAALQAALATEAAARKQGDADTLGAGMAYTDNQVSGEAAARKAGDAALQAALSQETADRKAGDAATLAAANANAAASVAAEAAARAAADAAEAAARAAAVAAEAMARTAGDAQTLADSKAYTNSRTPWPLSCANGQLIVSTGNGTWKCADPSSGLPKCAKGQIPVATGDQNNTYNCADVCFVNNVLTITDTSADPANCGGCGKVCPAPPNTTATCTNAKCGFTCKAGNFLDCDGDAKNGCEINTDCNATNCGKCGVACANGQGCQAGKCVGAVDVTQLYKFPGDGGPFNMPNPCGDAHANQYNCTNQQIGFQWTDQLGAGTVSSVSIEFEQGLTCNAAGARSAFLNGAAAGNFNFTAQGCTCNPPVPATTTIALPANSYTLAGTNTMTWLDTGSCEGTQNTTIQGTANLYAIVTVKAKTVPASCPAAKPVSACDKGTDPFTNSPWIVCKVDNAHAWVSANNGGNYHIDKICKSLGGGGIYSKQGRWGGTCGEVCGYCQGNVSSCMKLGTETYDNGNNGNNCGSDANGPIWCNTIEWECLP